LKFFLENYGINKKEYESFKKTITDLKLLQCIDKLRWAIGKRPELIKEKARLFKNVLQEYGKQ